METSTTNLEVKIQELDSRTKSNSHRLDGLEDRMKDQEKLVTSVATLTNEMSHIKDDMGEIKTDVRILVNKSGKTWDSLKDKLLWLVVGGILAWFIYTVTGVQL